MIYNIYTYIYIHIIYVEYVEYGKSSFFLAWQSIINHGTKWAMVSNSN